MGNLPATILHPEAFKSSPSADFDGAYHWEHWRRAINVGPRLNRGISPTDIDAIVEINNHFLMAETKDAGTGIKNGQMRTINALMRTGLFTFIARWGKAPPGDSAYSLNFFGKREIFCPPIVETEEKKIASWADWADKQPNDAWRLRLVRAAAYGAPEETKRRMIKSIQESP
jgi:hypothetical protein